MRIVIAFILEPAAYFLFAAFIFYHSRNDRRTKNKVLYLYYFIATILMTKASLSGLNGESNIEIYSFLCLITFICMGVYFYHTLTSGWKQKVVVACCMLEAAYYLTYNVFIERESVFDSIGHVLLSLGMMLMVFLFMHQVFANVKDELLSLNFDFWFVCSQMVYHLGAFAIFLTYNYLTKKILAEELYSAENRILVTKVWGVHNVLLFLSSLITASSVVWIAYHRKSQLS